MKIIGFLRLSSHCLLLASILPSSCLVAGAQEDETGQPLPPEEVETRIVLSPSERQVMSVFLVAPTAEAVTRGTYIPGSLYIPEFVPPPPISPKGVPVGMHVERKRVHPSAGGSLTILRGEPSKLPDIPSPPPARLFTDEELASIREAREAQPETVTLQIGGNVLDRKTSYIHWQHPETREAYEAVCGFDFGILASAGSFVHDGKIHYLMMMITHLDTQIIRRFAPYWEISGHPFVPADGFIVIRGNPCDMAGMAPLAAAHSVYLSEKDRLLAADTLRREHQEAAAEWRRNHPPQARSHTYWLRPHRGSRYLPLSSQ